jgi:hypothetical protein
VQEYLASVSGNEVIVFIDAYDVFALQDEATILRRFLHFEHDIVVSSEFQTSMFSDYCYKRMFGMPCRGLKVNAGMYMGYASALLEFYADLQAHNPGGHEKDDQKLMMRCCRESEFFLKRVAVDSEGTLFINLTWNHDKTEMYRIDEQGRIIVNRTNSEPCFVHGPGNSNLDEVIARYPFKAKKHCQRANYLWNGIKTNWRVYKVDIIVCLILLILLFFFLIRFFMRKQSAV